MMTFLEFMGTTYLYIVMFVITYPLVTSIIWEAFSLYYRFHWETHKYTQASTYTPPVSVIVPAYNEEKGIGKNLRALSRMSYENFEIVIINDGSTDNTVQECLPYLNDSRIRLINKKVNQGKALALNDSLPCLNGDIIVILDADAEPESDLLQNLVWHFQYPWVGAVTGHPRVKNVVNLLSRIQVVEFCSIIGLLRRSQRIWGNIMTISGIVAAFRKEAIYDVKGFRPEMYTEDIDITWRLQQHHWAVHYEPRAIVWMDVPTTLHGFFKQRLRWARGLIQVLKKNFKIIHHWKAKGMWLIYGEACLSISWCLMYGITFFTELVRFILSTIAGLSVQTSLQWTFVLFTATLIQLFIGILIEYRYDRDVVKFAPYAIFYPIFYWIFMVIVTLAAIPVLWKSWKEQVVWSSKRH